MADTRLLATCWQELDPRVVKELEAVFRGIKSDVSAVSAGGTGPAGPEGPTGPKGDPGEPGEIGRSSSTVAFRTDDHLSEILLLNQIHEQVVRICELIARFDAVIANASQSGRTDIVWLACRRRVELREMITPHVH